MSRPHPGQLGSHGRSPPLTEVEGALRCWDGRAPTPPAGASSVWCPDEDFLLALSPASLLSQAGGGLWSPHPTSVWLLTSSPPDRLRDGSEYLLRAPSQPLMNEWVCKLQQNSGGQPLLVEQGPGYVQLPRARSPR